MNLLPTQFKKDLSYELWRRFVLIYGTYFSLVTGVGIVFLLPSFFFLQFQIADVERFFNAIEESRDFKMTAEGRAQVEEVNSIFEQVAEFESRLPKSAPIIEDLLTRVPEGITLTRFDYLAQNTKITEISISGTSQDRSSLHAFADLLTASSYITEEVEPDLNDLLPITNLTFTLTFRTQL